MPCSRSEGRGVGWKVQSGGRGDTHIHTTVNLNGVQIRSDQDIKKLADEIARHHERIIRLRLP
jgi:tRNA U38,U39,U40 pseudouridine synthase TruA